MWSGMKSEHHPEAEKAVPLDDKLGTRARTLKTPCIPVKLSPHSTNGRKLLTIHVFHPHSWRNEKRRARQMAALCAERGFEHTAGDPALVAPEVYVTKPPVRPCSTGATPTGIDAEGLCAIPMLFRDLDLCS
jgi:hypothetical protein